MISQSELLYIFILSTKIVRVIRKSLIAVYNENQIEIEMKQIEMLDLIEFEEIALGY